MENKEINNKLSDGKKVILVLMLLLILLGFFGVLCGGFYSIAGLLTLDQYGGVFLLFGFPSLIIGIIFILLGDKYMKKKLSLQKTIDLYLNIKKYLIIISIVLFLIVIFFYLLEYFGIMSTFL